MHVLERPSTNGHVSSVTLAPPRRRSRWWFVALAALVVVAIVASLIAVRARAGAVAYTSVPVTQGSLAQTVTASGTLNPQNTISVGTQVSGTIAEIDTDYNAHVRKGQVLAKLDPTTIQAQLDQAQATLAQSEGATLCGLSVALNERCSFQDGRIVQTNFNSFRPLRIDEAPALDITLVKSDAGPSGIGEPPMTVVGPAVANAIFNACGVRLRSLPITPAAVLAGLRRA